MESGPDHPHRMCLLPMTSKNLAGGYVVIGQDCLCQRPPRVSPVGLADNQLDQVQQELLAACQLIQPPLFPVECFMKSRRRKLVRANKHRVECIALTGPTSSTPKHKTCITSFAAYKQHGRGLKAEPNRNYSPTSNRCRGDDRLTSRQKVSDLSKRDA